VSKLMLCQVCEHSRSWSTRCAHQKCKQCRIDWSSDTAYPSLGFISNEGSGSNSYLYAKLIPICQAARVSTAKLQRLACLAA